MKGLVRTRRAGARLAAGLAFCAASLSASSTWATAADAAHSQLQFTARESEVPLNGRFEHFAADVEFDPGHLQASKIQVDIETDSVDAGGKDANSLLRSPEFFDAQKFPRASFTSTSVVATGPGAFQASGPFTLKGKTANLVISFTARPDGSGLQFEGTAPISRLAYGVGQGQWADTSTLDDEVAIHFQLRLAH
jgi:polyisoprenoid-binding protein YceI